MAATRRLAMTYEPLLTTGGRTRIVVGLELRYLRELELDRGLAAEDVDEDLELHLVLVDLRDRPREIGERAFLDPHRLTRLVVEAGPGLLGSAVDALDLHLQDALDLFAGQRCGPRTEADEAGDAGRVAHDVPGVVIEVAPHQQIPGEDLLLDDDPLAVLELGHVLHG